MIFDDHDIVDDWNTSAAWLADMRATGWWRKRLTAGLMSYWVHQHLGNLSPDELADDPTWAAVHATPDGTRALHALAERAEADFSSVRFSYRRDFGRVRVVMVDSRAARVLEEGHRAMLDPAEAAWLREQVLADEGAYDHPPDRHLPALAAAAPGARRRGLGRGPVRRRARRPLGPLRRVAAAAPTWSTGRPSRVPSPTSPTLISEAAAAPDAPASVCVLSGDVHHGYLAEATWRAGDLGIPVVQLTCSPVHNFLCRARCGSVSASAGARRPASGPPPRPARPPPTAGALAQAGRSVVRQPACDPDPGRAVRPACAWNAPARRRGLHTVHERSLTG